MNESQTSQAIETPSFRGRHRFGLMIILAIFIASILVAVSMALYNSSGAAQLDLSRPGYNDVRKKVENSDGFQNYPNSGVLNTTVVTEFKSLFDQKAKTIESVDAFGGDPLSPNSLGISLTAIQ